MAEEELRMNLIQYLKKEEDFYVIVVMALVLMWGPFSPQEFHCDIHIYLSDVS